MSRHKATDTRFGGALMLLLVSVVFHGVYLGSIFDIYFVSPVVRVGTRYGVGPGLENGGPGAQVGEGLAKRVVLIVGDGLRADKLFQTYASPPFPYSEPLPAPVPNTPPAAAEAAGTTTPAPFIRSLIQSSRASWGVSHTRVPTESRPGHVALIGGLYEDVSAVTRGWQTNPVAFDSVFNQSSHTFSFGSPDILPMFKQGAKDQDKVGTWSYGEELEDFSTDAVHLDLWVLDQLEQLLRNASASSELDRTLRAEGTVFFLHLLGLDTTGHSYRPHGPEYHRNIRVVDYVVEETVKRLDRFYNQDGKTAFVLTADHGMSSKGNHGDGELDNTRTPLVVWGAGVTAGGAASGHDEYSEAWGLEGPRKDVDQADVAVLMSVLAGIPIPANSAGRVPLNYLDATPSFRARAAYANAKQVLAEFAVKSDFKEQHAVSFRPFWGLVDSPAAGTKSIASHKASIEGFIASGEFNKAEQESVELVKIGLDGLLYFQKYDWLVLRSIVAIGYVGFMVYSANFVLKTHVFLPPSAPALSSSHWPYVAGLSTFIVLAARFLVERSPYTYYLYAIFPCFFWSCILGDHGALVHLLSTSMDQSSPLTLIRNTGLVLGVLELMVYGYTARVVFAAVLAGMGWAWPTTMPVDFKAKNSSLLWAWVGACSTLAIFPILPVERGENLPVVMSGGVSFLALIWSALSHLGRDAPSKLPNATLSRVRPFVIVELLLIVASMAITWTSARSLQRKAGLPLINQLAGWVILVAATSIPILHGRPRQQPFAERLLVLLASFGPAFIILSLSYEALFYAAFSTTLCLWMYLETRLSEARAPGEAKTESQKGGDRIDGEVVRIALFFLAFLHVAFFGVGNVASISSFYLEPVYRLIPIFAPFPMAALLLFKLLTPFVALSAVTSILSHRLHLPPFVLFIIASTLSDVLTINFFFLVTDQGSWLEIGSTITNFAICSLLSIFNTVLFLLGEAVLAYTNA